MRKLLLAGVKVLHLPNEKRDEKTEACELTQFLSLTF